MKSILLTLKKLKTLLGNMVTNRTRSLNSKRAAWLRLKEEEDSFFYWAYGDAYVYHLIHKTSPLELLEAWNERHGDRLLIGKDELIGESLKKMLKLYKEEKNGMYSATA